MFETTVIDDYETVTMVWMDEELEKEAHSIDDCEIALSSYRFDDVSLERQQIAVRNCYAVEVTEIDNYMSLLLAMNRSPNHETGHYKRYRLVYPFHTALYVESVVMSIEHRFVAMTEKIETAR